MVNLTQYIPIAQIALTAFLPLIVTFLAGVLRQDGLPDTVNELISFSVALAVGFVQALAGGKLGGSSQSDFLIIVAYSQAALHSPLLQGFQQYLQGNVLNVIKPASPAPVEVPPAPAPVQPEVPAVDYSVIAQIAFDLLKQNAPQIANLVGVELSKQIRMGGVTPAPVQQSGGGQPGYTGSNVGVATHVDELPTRTGIPTLPRSG